MEATRALLAFIEAHEAAVGHVPDVLLVPREMLAEVMREKHPQLVAPVGRFVHLHPRDAIGVMLTDPVLAGVALASDPYGPGVPGRCDAGGCAQRYGYEVRSSTRRALPRVRSAWAM
jgi:hypothetical protein